MIKGTVDNRFNSAQMTQASIMKDENTQMPKLKKQVCFADNLEMQTGLD